MAKEQKYTLIKKIQDDTFEVDHLHEYILSIQLGSSIFRFCVMDYARNRCMLIEDYYFTQGLDATQILEQLELIYDDHRLLQAGFWKTIKLSIKNTKFSLIPNSLFSEQHSADYLAFSCNTSSQEEVYYYKHGSSDTINIFAAERIFVQWFRAKYVSKVIEVVHHASLMIEGILQNYGNQDQNKMYVSVADEILTIVVKRNNELLFCNNFKIKTANDFVYFVMFVFEELDLNPDIMPLILHGDIQKQSDHFSRLYRYVRHVQFGNKPTAVKFGYKFDEISDHSYFDLFTMHLCG